jgi:hypothetical protein
MEGILNVVTEVLFDISEDDYPSSHTIVLDTEVTSNDFNTYDFKETLSEILSRSYKFNNVVVDKVTFTADAGSCITKMVISDVTVFLKITEE